METRGRGRLVDLTRQAAGETEERRLKMAAGGKFGIGHHGTRNEKESLDRTRSSGRILGRPAVGCPRISAPLHPGGVGVKGYSPDRQQHDRYAC